MEYCGFTEPVQKSRLARGLTINLFRKNNETYRFCDLVSTHTMRRTAITNMLYLGMNENTVRQISGHSPNSKEFFRYVNFSQSILDQQINIYHDALKKSTLLE
jgi:integrase